MNLKTKERLIKYIFFIEYIALMISAIVNKWNTYTDFGWFKFAFTAPYIELTRIISLLIPFKYAYLFSFILLLIPMTFIIKICKKNISNFFASYKEIIKVYMTKTEEVDDRVEQYFDIFEKYDTGLIKIFVSMFFFFIYVFFLRSYLSILLTEEIASFITIDSYNLLWFDLKGGEVIPILFILYIVLTFGLTLIFNVKKLITNKQNKNEIELEEYQEKKHTIIYQTIVSFSLFTLSLYFVKVSVPFAIFLNFINIVSLIGKIKNRPLNSK